jgi:hypothetical protein
MSSTTKFTEMRKKIRKVFFFSSNADIKSFHKSLNYINPLKPNGNYMCHQLQQSLTLHFVFIGFI